MLIISWSTRFAAPDMFSVSLPRIIRTTSFKLAAFHVLILALSFAILGFVAFWIIESVLERYIVDRIDEEVAFLQRKFQSDGPKELIEEVNERQQSFVGGVHLEYLVMNAHDDRLAGTLPFMPNKVGWSDVTFHA